MNRTLTKTHTGVVVAIAALLLVGAMTVLPQSTKALSWGTPMTIDSSSASGANTFQYTSLKLDPNGYPHISYYDATHGSLSYYWVDSTGSHRVTLDGAVNVGQYCSLALGTNGDTVISYYDAANGNLKCLRQGTLISGSSYIQRETVDSTGNVGQYTSLALDTNGNPHISYYDVTNRDLKYAYKDGSGWHIQTVDNSGSDTGQYTSIAVDANGRPHISYYADYNTYSALRYAYKDSSGWHKQTIQQSFSSTGVGDAQEFGQYSSLALDTSGNPHISYDNLQSVMEHISTLMYAYKDSSGWHIEQVDGGGFLGDFRYTSLAFASGASSPCISYYSASSAHAYGTPNDLKYAWKDATGWHTQKVDGTDISGNDVGEYCSLALRSSYPYISYYDATNGALKYVPPGPMFDERPDPPTISTLTVPTTVAKEKLFTVSVTYGGSTRLAHSISWNWGDGTSSTSTTVEEPSGTTLGGGSATHAYATTGVYTVVCTVNGGDGTATKTAMVKVISKDSVAQDVKMFSGTLKSGDFTSKQNYQAYANKLNALAQTIKTGNYIGAQAAITNDLMKRNAQWGKDPAKLNAALTGFTSDLAVLQAE